MLQIYLRASILDEERLMDVWLSIPLRARRAARPEDRAYTWGRRTAISEVAIGVFS
jgi:hypothetical protein